jgi:hypothetical protein
MISWASLSCMAATRLYYIAAENVTWDYAPSGRDLIHGGVDVTLIRFSEFRWC